MLAVLLNVIDGYCTYSWWCVAGWWVIFYHVLGTVAIKSDVFSTQGRTYWKFRDDKIIDPSVTVIPADAFRGCNQLVEVEFCEGLVHISLLRPGN